MKKATKKDLRILLKSLYGKGKEITNAMIEKFKFYLHKIQAKLGIPVIRLEDCKPRLHISKSNMKTNIPSFSTYPGDSIIKLKDGRKVSDFKGTCKNANCESCKHWKTCYAIRMLRYPEVAKSFIENTLLLRENITELEKQLIQEILKLKSDLFRFDVSGEIESYEQLEMFLNVANAIPNKTFYVYTKNYDVVNRYFDEGNELPNNFHILISIWHDSGIDCFLRNRHHKNIHAFIYNDGFNYDSYGLLLLNHCQCKAYDIKGKMNHDITCNKCKKCWTQEIIWTYPH